MIGSMYAGISGLKAHQVKMDVVGNNIANVNTAGFKKSMVHFAEAMARTVQGARAPQDGMGGTNPIQVGLGARISSISTNFAEGSQQTTGRKTDMRISGKGFFRLNDGNGEFYTRAGNFDLDGDGKLVASNGMKAQGWMASKNADGTSTITAGTPITDLNIKLGEILPGKATQNVSYKGNLQKDSGIKNIKLTVDDGSGLNKTVDVDIIFNFDKENKKWKWKAKGPAGSNVQGQGAFELDAKGNISKVFSDEMIEIKNNFGVLIKPPLAGMIRFSEAKDVTNSAKAEYGGNRFITSNEVYDSLGQNHTLGMDYTKLDENVWDWKVSTNTGDEMVNGRGFISFDAIGQVAGNYSYAESDDETPTTLVMTKDGTGKEIPSYPRKEDLGIGWDTGDKLNYYIPEGLRNKAGKYINKDGEMLTSDQIPAQIIYGNPKSAYELTNSGMIKYRGPVDDLGNELEAAKLDIVPEPGKIMNNSFTGTFSFDPAGEGGATPPHEGANRVVVNPDFSRVTQFTAETTIAFDSQNGYGMGELETFRINETGDVMGYYSNGYKQAIGRVALVNFFNPGGLEKAGGSVFRKTTNSGEAIVMKAGTGGMGTIASEALEMSNVDLAEEFTDMIIAQRGFQANSKSITTSDEMLQGLINLKR